MNQETRTFNKQACQGDLMIRRIEVIPADAVEQSPEQDATFIVAHSETGHHHVVDAPSASSVKYLHSANDAMVAFLKVTEQTTLRHLRSFDTHQPITIAPGNYELRRQREYQPQGWRVVQD